MAYISDEISEVIARLGIAAKRLTESESDSIRKQLHQRFGLDLHHFNVQITADSESVHHRQAWSWIARFVGSSEVILLFPECNEPDAWILPDGQSLVEVLGECTGFVFFVTSRSIDYLLAFDDHDCLVGAGTAIEWVKNLDEAESSSD